MLKHSSTHVRSLTKQAFGRKHIAYGRILEQWKDIVGEQNFKTVTPIAVKYRKERSGEYVATLKVAAPSAMAMQIAYQKMMMLEKINMLIGKPRFVDIHVEHQAPAQKTPKVAETQSEYKTISVDNEHMLIGITDEALRERLKSFLNSASTKK